MEQFDLFDNLINEKDDSSGGYTKKIKAPIYEPKNKKPHILELYNNMKTNRLINEIKNSKIEQYEKDFLIKAAHRHTVFNFSKIADYYANSSKEMQILMEHSALIIIDFEKALQYGYVKLSDKMTNEYLKETNKNKYGK